MNLSKQPYKGARDFYPEEKRVQKYIFSTVRQVLESYGYQEYDAPILEPLDIYLAKTGEEIINEQIYSFEDRGGRKVAIRPEMTPSVSRMVAAKRQELAYPLRWYSIPNLWRYERPQRGRLREHWQVNADIFGVEGVKAEHEVITLADNILKAFNAKPGSYTIRVNSRQLVKYFLSDHLGLNEDNERKVTKLIDRIHKIPREEFIAAASELISDKNHVAQLMEYINSTSLHALPSHLKDHEAVKKLTELLELLDVSGVKDVVYDPTIIRGLDYYTDIVFEIFDNHPENNRAILGGGRYDGLVEMFDVERLPVVGFGLGDVSFLNFLSTNELLPALPSGVDATVILIGDVYKSSQAVLAELRQKGVNIALDNSDKKLDSQIKTAVKTGVRYALFIGEEEINNNMFKLKDLEKGEEQVLTIDEISSKLSVHKVD